MVVVVVVVLGGFVVVEMVLKEREGCVGSMVGFAGRLFLTKPALVGGS